MEHATAEDAALATKIAKYHFAHHQECPWEAVDKLTQDMIVYAAYAWLQDAKRALIEAGWIPPTTPEAQQS